LKKLSFRTSRPGSLTGEAPVPYGDDFGVKNEEIGLKMPIFGMLISNNQ
jgi:hypothetical protein